MQNLSNRQCKQLQPFKIMMSHQVRVEQSFNCQGISLHSQFPLQRSQWKIHEAGKREGGGGYGGQPWGEGGMEQGHCWVITGQEQEVLSKTLSYGMGCIQYNLLWSPWSLEYLFPKLPVSNDSQSNNPIKYASYWPLYCCMRTPNSEKKGTYVWRSVIMEYFAKIH
jgi:hypothetical protein